MAQLERALADPANRSTIDVAAAVPDQATHFDMLGLQLGYVYDSEAIAQPAVSRPEADPVRHYEPVAGPGARLPHGWLAAGVGSTLDLVDQRHLTLISVGDHEAWTAAANGAGAPIHHVRVGLDAIVDEAWLDICQAPVGRRATRPPRSARGLASRGPRR